MDYGTNFSGSEAGYDKNLLRVSSPDPLFSWPWILRFRSDSALILEFRISITDEQL